MAFVENRSTQALDTQPDLPIAQEYPIHTQADIPINFGQSLALASLSKGRKTYNDYMVKGDVPFPFGFGKIDGVKRFTDSNASNYRRMGYSVVLVEDTGGILKPKPTPTTTGGGTTSNGHGHVFETLHPKQTKQLIKIGVDTTKLGKDTTVLGKKLTEAKIERDRIEARIMSATEKQDIHDKLTSLGTSVSDVSSGLSAHELIPHNPLNPLGNILPYILIGGVALLALRKKR